jgi:hypothetical protein
VCLHTSHITYDISHHFTLLSMCSTILLRFMLNVFQDASKITYAISYFWTLESPLSNALSCVLRVLRDSRVAWFRTCFALAEVGTGYICQLQTLKFQLHTEVNRILLLRTPFALLQPGFKIRLMGLLEFDGSRRTLKAGLILRLT